MDLIGDSGISRLIEDWKHGFLPSVTAGLNNQRLKLKSRHREYSKDEGSFGRFLDKLFD
jgi:hypothetical protein